MAVVYKGHNPQISKDWNGSGVVIIAPLNTRSSSFSTQANQIAMDSPEYAKWHRQHVVMPLLIATQKMKK